MTNIFFLNKNYVFVWSKNEQNVFTDLKSENTE